jgi:hypothetical protein
MGRLRKVTYFAGYEIIEGETFIEAVCRQVPFEERLLSAFAINIIAFCINYRYGKKEEKKEIVSDKDVETMEKDLTGIGISVREIVDGIEQIRSPADVIQELSKKFKFGGGYYGIN